jgi:hypothetical protein
MPIATGLVLTTEAGLMPVTADMAFITGWMVCAFTYKTPLLLEWLSAVPDSGVNFDLQPIQAENVFCFPASAFLGAMTTFWGPMPASIRISRQPNQ